MYTRTYGFLDETDNPFLVCGADMILRIHSQDLCSKYVKEN